VKSGSFFVVWNAIALLDNKLNCLSNPPISESIITHPVFSADKPMRIITIDDHELVREAVGYAIDANPDMSVVSSHDTATAGLGAISELRPDLVIVDFTLPDMTGLELIQQARPGAVGTRFMILTGSPLDHDECQRLATFAEGFLHKEEGRSELISAIRTTMSQPLLQSGPDANPTGGLLNASRLTERERQLMHEIARGHAVQEIAEKLDISVSTVRKHRENIMEKLELNTTAQLVRAAMQIGQY